MKKILLPLLAIFCSGCVELPEGIEPVDNFDLEKYMGKWYEVARLDHRFERGLNNVTADYVFTKDGNIKVVNRGFSTKKDRWSSVVGKAKFAGKTDVGYLKVSFFGPFYGPYIIFELDEEDYQYAFVTSSSKKYLWFLSRQPIIDETLKKHFLDKVQQLGFDTEKLIFVDQKSD